jgi:hypothetical protein
MLKSQIEGVVGLLALGLAAGCGLDATGEVAANFDATASTPTDATSPPLADAASDVTKQPDASKLMDAPHDTILVAESSSDGHKDVTQDGSGDSPSAPDVAVPFDGGVADGAQADAAHADSAAIDAGTDATSAEAGGSVDGSLDSTTVTDAALPVDASGPPSQCNPFTGYTCGSATCTCDQTCNGDGTCGACTPNHATCGGFEACGTDLTTILNCGACGNLCVCLGLSTCNESGGVYTCGCIL